MSGAKFQRDNIGSRLLVLLPAIGISASQNLDGESGELLAEFFLGHVTWNKLNIYVGVEGSLKVGSNRAGVLELVIFLANEFVDNEEVALGERLLVHLFNGSLGIVGILEADISIILESLGLLITLNCGRDNFTKVLEHLLKFSVVSSFRKVLYE